MFLYGDKTIKVDRAISVVLLRCVPPPGSCGVGFGSSPYLATDYTIYELCLPSARCMGMSMDLVDPVSSGKYCGTFVSTVPAADPAVLSFTVLFFFFFSEAPSLPLQLSGSRALLRQTALYLDSNVQHGCLRLDVVVMEVSLQLVHTILFGTA